MGRSAWGGVKARGARGETPLRFRIVVVSLPILLACGAGGGSYGAGATSEASPATAPEGIVLRSGAFPNGGAIPRRFTCDGADTSPPLVWSNVPDSAVRLALVAFDPDAPDPANPRTVWDHWVVYDIPASETGVAEGKRPEGGRDGTNSWGRTGYGGPCPPIGRHRYFFRLYALDGELGDLGEPTREELQAAMRGHVLAVGTLVGTYRRKAD